MRKKKHERDVDECAEKIEAILKEYNCMIEYDNELEEVIVVDQDTSQYMEI